MTIENKEKISRRTFLKLSLFTIGGTAISLSGCNPTNSESSLTPTNVPTTEIAPKIVSTVTPPPVETPTNQPLPTETMIPKQSIYESTKDKGVDLFEPVKTNISYFSNTGERVSEESYIPLYYEKGLMEYENEKIIKTYDNPLNGKGLTGVDSDQNIRIQNHSGFILGLEPLPAEELRKYLEGSTDTTINDANYFESKADKLRGGVFAITQNNHTVHFKITALARLPHSLKSQYDSNFNTPLDTINQYYSLINDNNPFSQFKDTPGLLYDFCGWGPSKMPKDYQEANYYGHGRYIWSAIVFGLSPIKEK